MRAGDGFDASRPRWTNGSNEEESAGGVATPGRAGAVRRSPSTAHSSDCGSTKNW
jgi:hypothetical protein